MKDEIDVLMMNTFKNDLNYTGVGDKSSGRKTFLTKKIPKMIEVIQNRTFIEIDLEGQGVKIMIPSNFIVIYIRLKILLGTKLSGLTETLIQASDLIDDLYKRGEIQNEQQYRNAHDNFLTQ